MLEPIVPFEPILSETIPEGSEWLAQVKWDGVRVLTCIEGSSVRLFNRKRHERTQIFPELVDVRSSCSSHSVMLDGEVIALGPDGKPSFREVMRRDGIHRLDRIRPMIDAVPIYYMLFDVVFYNGEWISCWPLEKRLDLLETIIVPNTHIRTVSSCQDGAALFQAVRAQNLEGIVVKKRGSRYAVGGKNADWRKIKNYKDLIAAVGGITYRSEKVNSLLLGLFDDTGRLWYVGHAGTGKFSDADWTALTRAAESLKTDTRPFINLPARASAAQWLRPELTVKIRYIEWPAGHSIRQPSIQAVVRAEPRVCRFPEDHRPQ